MATVAASDTAFFALYSTLKQLFCAAPMAYRRFLALWVNFDCVVKKPMGGVWTKFLLIGKKFFSHAGYLWVRFEYFRGRFVLQPIPAMVTLVTDRAQRALSIPLITFSPIAPCRLKMQNTARNNVKKMQQ